MRETHSCGASPVFITGLNPDESTTVPPRHIKNANAAAAYTSIGNEIISKDAPDCARSNSFHCEPLIATNIIVIAPTKSNKRPIIYEDDDKDFDMMLK